MLLADREPSASGRNSRASDMSAASRGPSRGSVTAVKQDMLSANPTVASMLRTWTEMGNLGGFVSEPIVANVPRAPRRGGATSRLSIASSRSNASNRTTAHHRHWHPAASAGTRDSRENNRPRHTPDTLSSTVLDISGSSRPIPLARDHMVAPRSLSMIMANGSGPTFRLPSDRSLTSLRNHDHLQRPKSYDHLQRPKSYDHLERPKSPFMFPARFQRPRYRPSSTALTDTAGSYPRRRHGYSDHDFPLYIGQMRLCRPSETAARRPPSRSRTPGYYGDLHPDVPPVPPLVPHRYTALERERKSQKPHRSASHRSGNHSISSGSMNRRTDSDIQSSDSTSPPTPGDGDILNSPVSMTHSIPGTVNAYGYREEYETREAIKAQAGIASTGIVRHIKTIIEERGTPEPAAKGSKPSSDKVDQHVDGVVLGTPKLPASPVPRRITRDQVMAGIGLESSSEAQVSGAPWGARSTEQSRGHVEDGQVATLTDSERQSVYPTHTMYGTRNRHSILSQAESSVMGSSTMEVAVRCSILMGADNSTTLDMDNETITLYSPDADPTSEDLITDLIQGGQRTDTKEEGEGCTGPPGGDGDGDDEPLEKRSNHAAQSSDDRPFNACTDLVNVADRSAKGSYPHSSKSQEPLPELDPPCKDSDVKSLRTCKDVPTPIRVISFPPSRLDLSRCDTSELPIRRPFTELSSSSLSTSDRKASPSETLEASISRVVGRLRTNSKQSSTRGPATDLFSLFKGSGDPPAAPPRESSSSKEGQQSSGVPNFFLRSVRQRFSKVRSKTTLRPKKEAAITGALELENLNADGGIPTPPPMKERKLMGNIVVAAEQPWGTLKAPRRALTERMVPHSQSDTMVMRGSRMAPKEETLKPTSGTATPSDVRLVSVDIPSPLMPEVSSAYLPEDIPCNGCRNQASPIVFAQTTEQNRRDTQTTTHLSWNGSDAFHSLSIDRARDIRTNDQDNTTTDLRPPGYRHPINHLPELKEESHEYSSFDTSASNFQRLGGRKAAAFRMSTDDTAPSCRFPSARSSRDSLLQHMHLPSMNFSSFGSFDETLDHHVSRSLDLFPAPRTELSRAIAVRPASAGEDRGKYRTVFAGLDIPAKPPGSRQHAGVDVCMRKSPDMFVKEVDSLTIPSVSGLTIRLSEMLPTLGEALGLGQVNKFPDEEDIMEKAMEKLSEVCVPVAKRSSARLRPVPGSPNMLVVDDEVFEEITGQERTNLSAAWTVNRGHAGIGEKAALGANQTQGATALVGSSVAAHGRTRDGAAVHTAELKTTPHTHLRHNTNPFSPRHFPTPSSKLSSNSARSVETTPTATATDIRPWNLDKNYPWAADPSVDISLPPVSRSKRSAGHEPSHLRNPAPSASLDSAGTSSPYSTSAPPPTRRGPKGRCHKLVVDGRRSLDPQVIGFDASGYPIGPVRVHDDDQSQGAGGRYPTSALPLPANLHIYPGQSSNLSLDTSDEEPETISPRKALFSHRPRRDTRSSANRRGISQARVRELQHSRATERNPIEPLAEIPGCSHRETFRDAKGMSRVTYLAKKVVLSVKNGTDKVRNWVLCCPRSASPESDSTDITAPANSEADRSSEETVVPGRRETPEAPAIRSNPGRRFTPGFFISFPFPQIPDDGPHRGSAFQSNIPPRNYGTTASEAVDRPASH